MLRACLVLFAFEAFADTLQPADLILKNGRMYTDQEGTTKWSEALAIRDGTILSIGTNAAIEKDRGPLTRVINLSGRVVLPGFNDSKAHVFQKQIATPSSIRKEFLQFQSEANQLGITSIHCPVKNDDELKVLAELYRTKQLHLRMAVWGDLEKPNEFLAAKERYALPEEWIRFHAVEGKLDQSLREHTAALSAPYFDDPKLQGALRYSQEKLNELVVTANRLGLPVILHAAGDRAVSLALNSILAARRQLFNSRIRNKIAAFELAPVGQTRLFKDYGITVSMQPSQAVFNIKSRIGSQRMNQAFAWKSLLKEGTHVAFGSGWPTNNLSPFFGIYSALHIRRQKLTLSEAIEVYTLGGAWATQEEHIKGSIREGKLADLVVLGRDPFTVSAKELLKIPVYLTIVSGQIIYDASQPKLEPAGS